MGKGSRNKSRFENKAARAAAAATAPPNPDAALDQDVAALKLFKEEIAVRAERKKQSTPGIDADGYRISRDTGLLAFIRYFWDVLEPEAKFVEGWVLDDIARHLEAVTLGKITRLMINVSPGSMKSLMTNVFWPAWEWGPMKMPHLRYVSFAYSSGLTERDNIKFRKLVTSEKYKKLWGDVFELEKEGEIKITNNKTGSKFASSVTGIGLGERGDRVILDDPHDVKRAESDVVRTSTLEWFRGTITDRLNNLEDSAIVIIMQRVHARDICGLILSEAWDFNWLMIPMEYEEGRSVPIAGPGVHNALGWTDPRTEDGELAWPERFTPAAIKRIQMEKGSFYYCNPYDAPVLMADLSMRPIGEVQAGDQIVGFSTVTEGERRRLVEAEVLSVSVSRRKVVRVTLASGEVIRCTADHKWYTRRSDGSHALYKAARVGSTLMRVCPSSLPNLKAEQLRAAGWLSGFFDGEGSAVRMGKGEAGRHPNNNSCLISFYQSIGRNLPLCEKLEQNLELLGFSFGQMERPVGKSHRKVPGRMYYLKGNRLPVYQRFLHLVQPNKWKERIRSAAFGAKFIVAKEKVVSIEEAGEETVYGLETTTGNYVVWGLASSNSGQYQQRPAARSGGIIKFEHWQPYDPNTAAARFGMKWPQYPVMTFSVLAVDTAQTEKKQNDPSAAVLLGVCQDAVNLKNQVMLMYAWSERLEFYDLCMKVEQTCQKFRVDKVIIEDKASGLPLASELRRRARVYQEKIAHGKEKYRAHANFTVQTVKPDGDKVARAYSVQGLFEAGVVWAPSDEQGNFKYWADLVRTECAELPKGAHDDLADAMVYGLKFLREIGIALMPDDFQFAEEDAMQYKRPEKPLYPWLAS